MSKDMKYLLEILALRAENIKKQLSFIDDIKASSSDAIKAVNAFHQLDERLTEFAIVSKDGVADTAVLLNEIEQLYSKYHKYYFKKDEYVKLKDRVLSKYKYIIQKYAY